MDAEQIRLMFEVEDYHWWYVGMKQVMQAILDRYYLPNCESEILDAGCGTGGSIHSFLRRYGHVTGVDVSICALGLAQSRGLAGLACSSIEQLPCPADNFDLVTSFDVMSDGGVKSDHAVLQEFHRVLKPGGRLLLRLPAFSWLHGRHDEAVYTKRRYSITTLQTQLSEVGFVVDFYSYINFLMLPLVAVKRWSEVIFPGSSRRSDLQGWPTPINNFLARILCFESILINRITFPVGSSLTVLGSKPHG